MALLHLSHDWIDAVLPSTNAQNSIAGIFLTKGSLTNAFFITRSV